MSKQPGTLGLFDMLDSAASSRVCRECGCTDDDACLVYAFLDEEQGCHWVEPDLCSGCAYPEARIQGPRRDHRVTPAEEQVRP